MTSTLTSFWSLSEADIEPRLRDASTNPVAHERRRQSRLASWAHVILRQFASPVTLILVVAALLAAATGDTIDGSIIVTIVVLSALLGAWQEGRAADAVSELLASVAVTITVERDGETITVPTSDVLPGDRVTLAAGDIIPGDCLVLSSDDLMVDESALTGEAFPVSKAAVGPLPADTALAERSNSLFAGTHTVSGTATALVVLTGANTTFGHITSSLRKRAGATSFEVGVRKFGLLLLRVMLALVAVILAINLTLHRPLIDSLLFALALAVGITPQMLPVVVSVSLASGARRMAKRGVIVKRVDVIEDLGSLSVLCTDKTGTITTGAVDVEGSLSPDGSDDPRVLQLAVLNAGLQTGYANPLDEAILHASPLPSGTVAIAEIPYDFERKRMSVLVDDHGTPTLITKGSLDSLLACCTHCLAAGQAEPMDARLDTLRTRARELGESGLRVVGVAVKTGVASTTLTHADETGMTFAGFLTFRDPIKADVTDSIAALAKLGVGIKVVSGDNRYVTASLAPALGLDPSSVMLGEQLEELHGAELHQAVLTTSLFAEVDPMHKVLIVKTLREAGQTVGFLGDGINDAAAIHAADVGLSVNTAVSVAKEAAAIVLLEPDLDVVAAGVRLGRLTFSNTLKYVRVAASANFGNILSMVIAAALLPFLPMLPAQILLLNFLADIPNTLISRDRVDPERLAHAGTWDMRAVTRFMVVFGAVSTAFDLVTFGLLVWVFHADQTLFHTGWFVESALTQFVAMMTLRTSRPAWTSRPDSVFLGVSILVAAVTATLPFTPLAPFLGFVGLPVGLLFALFAVAVAYGLANELTKRLRPF